MQLLQDHGATFDTGSATHALVLHRGPDGKGGGKDAGGAMV